MPLSEATALADIHIERYDPLADLQALQQLAQWCEQFSPAVSLEDTERPESLLLNTTGIARLFGNEEALAQRVQRSLHQHGYTASVAIAATIGAAWGLAHYAKDTPAVVPSSKTYSALDVLPVEALRLPIRTVQVLQELGVHQIDQLLALPRSALGSRFDSQLTLRIAQALGEVSETLSVYRPSPEIEADLTLEYPTERRDAVQLILTQLVEKISKTLQQYHKGAIRLECTLKCEGSEPLRLLVGLYRATAVSRHLLELILMQLERVRLPGPVSTVRISVLIAATLKSEQQELFADEAKHHQAKQQLGLLIDRLSSRLGRNSVSRAVPVADAQPEYAYRYEPLAGVKPLRMKEAKPHAFSHRPLQLRARPLRLEVFSVVPHGPPAQFNLHTEQHRIACCWGPERIQTGWWRGHYVRRDYYKIETTAGRRF